MNSISPFKPERGALVRTAHSTPLANNFLISFRIAALCMRHHLAEYNASCQLAERAQPLPCGE